MQNVSFITRDEYLAITNKYDGGHWTPDSIASRWDYHNRTIELIKGININKASDVLEMGTMGISCVKDSDTIDHINRWDFPGKQPTYIHDAKVFPWPVKDKQYEVFVALRVFQHLTPFQMECTKEAMRIAKKVIIVIPDTYNNTVLPESKGITYPDFTRFLDGIHPNLYLQTANGFLYFWDTENPSKTNIQHVMEKVTLVERKIVSSEGWTTKFKNLVKRVLRKFK